MIFTRRFSFALALCFGLGLVAQAVHRHGDHEGGIVVSHVDCGLCAWVGKAGGAEPPPAVSSRVPAPAPERFLPAGDFPAFFTPVALPFGRAPPSLSFL